MRALAIRFLRDRHGGSTVEFGVVLPILVTLLLGVFEFGRLFWSWSTIQYATEEAGRYAMLNPAASESAISDFLKGRLTGISASTVDVQLVPEVDGSINYTLIVAKVHFAFLSLIPITPVDIEGRSRVPRVL
jgi:Flp pilus assembly protein TadG